MSNPWKEFNVNHVNDLSYRTPYNLPAPNPIGDISAMPWSTITNPSQVVMFKALGQYPEHSTVPLHTKRKHPLPPEPIPTKKMLTEERMAAHLSNLHISSEDRNPFQPLPSSDDANISNYTVNMSQWDLERKLRTAQKITICNEILEMDKRDNLLPEILLNRIEKPCSALVLWQPPRTLANLVDSSAERDDRGDKKGKETPPGSDEMETELT